MIVLDQRKFGIFVGSLERRPIEVKSDRIVFVIFYHESVVLQ